MSSYLPLAPVALRGLTRKRRHKQLRRAFAAFGSPRKPAATRGSSCSSRALANCLIGAAVSVHNAKAPQALNSNEESGISSPSSKKEKLAIIFLFFFLGKKLVSQRPRTSCQQPVSRREVLRAGLESLVQQRELQERQGRPRPNPARRKDGAVHAERNKADVITKVCLSTQHLTHSTQVC